MCNLKRTANSTTANAPDFTLSAIEALKYRTRADQDNTLVSPKGKDKGKSAVVAELNKNSKDVADTAKQISTTMTSIVVDEINEVFDV